MNTNRLTHLDYCQYLLVSQVNYTITNFAAHSHKNTSHDAINRYLRDVTLTPRLVWDSVREQIIFSENGYLIFDDSVLDKDYSHKIQLVNRQYSGNAHRLIKGIGVVNCVYVNPETNQSWVIDFRIYDVATDGKSKLQHLQEMLKNAICSKGIPFKTVLIDTWYATKDILLLIEAYDKYYYCPLKSNRLVDDSAGVNSYQNVDNLEWREDELLHGKLIKINKFPKTHKVKLFRVVVSEHRTEWIVTNDLTQNDTDETRKACAIRWKIEQFHRELKQLTGIEKNQCRKARIQRNHITCAMLVWVRLTQLAQLSKQTVYALKQGLLADYLKNELKNPTFAMVGA